LAVRLSDWLVSILLLCAAAGGLQSFPTRRSSDLVTYKGKVQVSRIMKYCSASRYSPYKRYPGHCHKPCIRLHVGYLMLPRHNGGDRKSTRLNSSHVKISYAVFCLKKKKQIYRAMQ